MAPVIDAPLGLGWDRMRGWSDQWDRMLRWHTRLVVEIEREAQTGDWSTWPHDLWDAAMAFFQSAFHLKDWIIRERPESREVLELAVSANPRLALCADIANGTKHGRVERHHRTGAHVVGVREFAPDVRSQARWLVLGEDGPINLDVLAHDVLHAWEHIIHEYVSRPRARP